MSQTASNDLFPQYRNLYCVMTQTITKRSTALNEHRFFELDWDPTWYLQGWTDRDLGCYGTPSSIWQTKFIILPCIMTPLLPIITPRFPYKSIVIPKHENTESHTYCNHWTDIATTADSILKKKQMNRQFNWVTLGPVLSSYEQSTEADGDIIHKHEHILS